MQLTLGDDNGRRTSNLQFKENFQSSKIIGAKTIIKIDFDGVKQSFLDKVKSFTLIIIFVNDESLDLFDKKGAVLYIEHDLGVEGRGQFGIPMPTRLF